MKESILQTIKQMLGLEEDYNVFDQDIMIGINAALGTLKNVGALADTHYIRSDSNTWDELGASEWQLELIKEYLYIKVKLVFDVPTSSQVINAFTERAKELEWRLYYGDDLHEDAVAEKNRF